MNTELKQQMKKLLTVMSVAAFLAVASLAIAQQAPDAEAIAQQAPRADVNSSLRLEARLQPVIAVDASGQARLDAEVGTANDRFTYEVEIAKADFAELGITPRNGFRDEVVELRVLRGGGLIFSNRLQFSRNLLHEITFETDIRGAAAPELQAGDVARVIVNGHFTLRGAFQVH
jgi:ABC-type amino acid transport substrate-binding protein